MYAEEPLNRLQLIEQYPDLIDRTIEFCTTRPSRTLQDRAAYILRLLASDYSLRTFLLEHKILPALKAAIQNGVREVRQHLYMTLEYLVARPLAPSPSAAQNDDGKPADSKKPICVPQEMIDLGLIPLLLERFKKEKGNTERIMLANVLSSVAVYDCQPLLLEPQAKATSVLNCLDICVELLAKFRDTSTDLTTAACRLLQTLCVSPRAKNLAAKRNLVEKLTKIAKESAMHGNLQQLRDDVLQVLGLITAITVNKHLVNTFQETMDVLKTVLLTTTPPPSSYETTPVNKTMTADELDDLATATKAEAMRMKARLHALTILCNLSENPAAREHLKPFITRRDVWLNLHQDPNELVRIAAARLRRIVMWNP